MHPLVAALKAPYERCSKCGLHPRYQKQRWCRECFNAYMRTYRAKKHESCTCTKGATP